MFCESDKKWRYAPELSLARKTVWVVTNVNQSLLAGSCQKQLAIVFSSWRIDQHRLVRRSRGLYTGKVTMANTQVVHPTDSSILQPRIGNRSLSSSLSTNKSLQACQERTVCSSISGQHRLVESGGRVLSISRFGEDPIDLVCLHRSWGEVALSRRFEKHWRLVGKQPSVKFPMN